MAALRPEKTIAHGYGGAERNGKVGDLTGVRQIWYNFDITQGVVSSEGKRCDRENI